ncbi:MAG: Ig-like domain-containing protein [Thermoanaerobaculia bacterium]
MKKGLLLMVIAVVALGASVAPPAHAVVCTVDNVPAATLLLPYFEVDLANPNGADTTFTINNASATAVLAHVTLWTDLGVPTQTFDIYLTGYDVEKVDLRLLFAAGVTPRTASAGQDPAEKISPHGPVSQDINFASCNGRLPLPPLTAAEVAHIRAAHTGAASPTFGGNCSGLAVGDNIARGYVTIDSVNACNPFLPDDPLYVPYITFQNVFFGNFEYVNRTLTTTYAGALVGVEASFSNPEVSVPGQYTFYGRYNNYTATDRREPLATQWQTRILSNAAFGQNTDLIVWRDPGVASTPFACGGNPSWYPLPLENLVLFDEQEFPVVPAPATSNLFAAAAQRIPASSLGSPYASGYVRATLSLPAGTGSVNPPEDVRARQSYVFAVTSSNGKYGIGLNGFALDTACAVLSHDANQPIVNPFMGTVFPGDGSTNVPVSQKVNFSFSEKVTITPTAFKIECPTGSNIPFTSNPAGSGPSFSFQLTPTPSLPANTACKATGFASQITGTSHVGANPPADIVTNFTTAP